MLRLLPILFLVTICAGYPKTDVKNNTSAVNKTVQGERFVGNSTSIHDTYEKLCSRSHTNTAFVGVQPYGKLLLASAGDCFRNCIESYPKCVAVVYYNLNEGDLNNVCYTFDRNSADKNVALVLERPAHTQDIIRAFEITPSCQNFNPVPPIKEACVKSTDTVSETMRMAYTTSNYYASSYYGGEPWSPWTLCSPRNPVQIRSQVCPYGRIIERNRCGYQYPAFRNAVVIQANVPYPPMGYMHPQCETQAYNEIMAQHVNQMRQYCCVQPETMRETYQTPEEVIKPCRQVCKPVEPKDEFMFKNNVETNELTHVIKGEPLRSEWNLWTEWSVCSATCDHGTQSRYRVCSRSDCPGDSVERRSCQYLEPCKTWADWSQWSECRASCGMGERVRSRFCHLGVGLCRGGKDFEVESCEVQPCAEWLPWAPWSYCTVTCGRGSKQRARSCSGYGCIGDEREVMDCEVAPCSYWAPWQTWSSCSVSCDMGIQERKRICIGNHCEGSAMDQTNCKMEPCPVWNEWGMFSMCSVSCGFGFTRRERTCASETMKCEGERVEIESCNLGYCSTWGEWQEWGFCSRNDGPGDMIRRRICLGPECYGGSPMDTKTCDNEPLGEWHEWGDWSTCSVTCGTGLQTRERACSGLYCPGHSVEEISCGIEECSTWTDWTEWSRCSATCGNGKQHRARVCSGYDCVGNAEDYRHCASELPCVEWSIWGEWTACSSHCGPGDRYRRRECMSGGYPSEGCFGVNEESSLCSDRPCCEWSIWGQWTACDRMCGGGRQTRMRHCSGSSSSCECPGNDKEQLDCNMQPCPTPAATIVVAKSNRSSYDFEHEKIKPDCIPQYDCPPPQPAPQPVPIITNNQTCHWTTWRNWSNCPSTCNFGVTRRHRYCVGDNRCACEGPSLEKINCAVSDQCRKKKK